jgi:hypothetical protein
MSASSKTKIALIDTQIAALQVKRAALVLESANEIDTDTADVGVTISFNYGKGENRTVRSGVVLGRKAAEGKSPALIKVAIGQGFDAEIVTIFPAQITAIVLEAAEEAAAE